MGRKVRVAVYRVAASMAFGSAKFGKDGTDGLEISAAPPEGAAPSEPGPSTGLDGSGSSHLDTYPRDEQGRGNGTDAPPLLEGHNMSCEQRIDIPQILWTGPMTLRALTQSKFDTSVNCTDQ